MAGDAGELTDFQWLRYSDGYRWVTGERRRGLVPSSEEGLTERFLVSAAAHEGRKAISYSPLTKSGLFRRFTETTPDETGIHAFATAFGFLGGAANTPVKVEGEAALRLQGEALASWVDAINRMLTMILIWDSATGARPSVLPEYIHWRESGQGPAVFYRSDNVAAGDDFELIASRNQNPDLFERFTYGEFAAPAMYLLQRRVNQQLAINFVTPKLLWDQRQGKLVIRLSASSLLGALWLQFAKAIEGNKQYRQCQNCREWFEVGGNRSARSDKKFCTPSCKSAFHRAKEEERKRRSDARASHTER